MNGEMDIPSDYDTSELMVSKMYFARNVYNVFRTKLPFLGVIFALNNVLQCNSWYVKVIKRSSLVHIHFYVAHI